MGLFSRKKTKENKQDTQMGPAAPVVDGINNTNNTVNPGAIPGVTPLTIPATGTLASAMPAAPVTDQQTMGDVSLPTLNPISTDTSGGSYGGFPTAGDGSYGGFPSAGDASYGGFPSGGGQVSDSASYTGFPSAPSDNSYGAFPPLPGLPPTDSSSASSPASGLPPGVPAGAVPDPANPANYIYGGEGGGDAQNGYMKQGVYDSTGKVLGFDETYNLNGQSYHYGYDYGGTAAPHDAQGHFIAPDGSVSSYGAGVGANLADNPQPQPAPSPVISIPVTSVDSSTPDNSQPAPVTAAAPDTSSQPQEPDTSQPVAAASADSSMPAQVPNDIAVGPVEDTNPKIDTPAITLPEPTPHDTPQVSFNPYDAAYKGHHGEQLH